MALPAVAGFQTMVAPPSATVDHVVKFVVRIGISYGPQASSLQTFMWT
jgi:hypothetical protein